VESIERDGEAIYRHNPASIAVTSVDQAAFYQLKSMMQGVLARGTARSIAYLSPYVAGKTGTSDDENDAWFIGFSNEVTIAVWIGYDNADGKRSTLGGGATGGGVAVPIFEPVMQEVWAHFTSKTALAPPSPEAKRQLACESIDLDSSKAQHGNGVTDCFRLNSNGKIIDTRYRLISHMSAFASANREDMPRHKERRASHEEERPARHRIERVISVRNWQQWGWGWAPQPAYSTSGGW
jgi:membrane carboxypeptidase/penicillin-binding protein